MLSVCMATYNGAIYIHEQITSILKQLSDEDELIISDDGSTDDTIRIIHLFKDTRIKLIQNSGRKGFVNNFENALNHASGDYIFLSDQDDIWKANKVHQLLGYLSEYDLVVHDAELIDGNGHSLGRNYYSVLHRRTSFLANLWKTRFLGCCMAFTKELKDACLPFPKNIVAHDYWIGMFALLKYRVYFAPDILISYRRHGGNVSPSSEKSNNSLYYKLVTKRLGLVSELLRKLLE